MSYPHVIIAIAMVLGIFIISDVVDIINYKYKSILQIESEIKYASKITCGPKKSVLYRIYQQVRKIVSEVKIKAKKRV